MELMGVVTLILPSIALCGAVVVTQNPPVLTLSKGQMATLDCNLATITNSAARWYKQIHGGVPQFVLYFHHSNTSPTYGSGYSSPKFNSNHKTKSDYSLIISNVDVADSAVYYCKTWDSSASEYVSQ
uniref:Ig-like domain-containing protein n=1 Tax=Sinocyclocheilus rhinocerous TaxID=307959 RepID=A0A673N8H3_9TELE